MYRTHIHLIDPRNLQYFDVWAMQQSLCWCWCIWMNRASTKHSCITPPPKAPTQCSLDRYSTVPPIVGLYYFSASSLSLWDMHMLSVVVTLSHCWPTTLMRSDKISPGRSAGGPLSTKLQLEKRNVCCVGGKRGGGESGLGFVRFG